MVVSQDNLQSLLILLKNSPDQVSDEKLFEIYKQILGEDFTTDELVKGFLVSEESLVELYRQIILYMSNRCSPVQATFILQALDDIIQLDQGSLSHEEFCIQLINNLLDHSEHFFSPEGFQIENNSLILSLEQNLMMISEMIGSEDGESTEISQKSIQILVKYIDKLDQGVPEIVSESQGKLVELLGQNLTTSVDTNKVVYIRFFEVAALIAMVSKKLCMDVAKPLITLVFADFFQKLATDVLTQVTIMDFVVKLSENEFGVRIMNESNFIWNLFEAFGGKNEDSFGFISSNMLLVGAKLYSIDTTLFNPFECPNYMMMFKGYLCGPEDSEKPHHKDVALSCLYFMLIQKDDCLVKHLIEKEDNHDIINSFLRVAKSTNTDHRQSFLVTMRQLLKKSHIDKSSKEQKSSAQEKLDILMGNSENQNPNDERLSDIYMMIFSNIRTPAHFPNQFGLLDQSISFLVDIAETPYENEEMPCLRLIKQLIKHKWGCKAFFQNQKAIKYTLERKGGKASKEITEKKYSLVDQLVKEQNDFLMDDKVVDAVIATQIQSFHLNGVYGIITGGGFQEIPEVQTI